MLTVLKCTLNGVAPELVSRGASNADIDDILQQTQTRLLVADGAQSSRLAAYSGAGRLGGFVRTVALRLWLDSRRGLREVDVAPSELDVLAKSVDPALENLKENYLNQFQAALAEAWRDLKTEHRDCLRYRMVDSLSIDQLAKVYGIHRSTAARRLVVAKDTLAAATRANLGQTLEITEGEIDSILRLIQTRLDLAADGLS